MICYRNMTFCTYYEDCANASNCERPLTPEVKQAAENWMRNPPICIFSEKPQCWETVVRVCCVCWHIVDDDDMPTDVKVPRVPSKVRATHTYCWPCLERLHPEVAKEMKERRSDANHEG